MRLLPISWRLMFSHMVADHFSTIGIVASVSSLRSKVVMSESFYWPIKLIPGDMCALSLCSTALLRSGNWKRRSVKLNNFDGVLLVLVVEGWARGFNESWPSHFRDISRLVITAIVEMTSADVNVYTSSRKLFLYDLSQCSLGFIATSDCSWEHQRNRQAGKIKVNI